MSEHVRNPVHWFEIPVEDLQRATAFYESITGKPLKAVQQGPYAMSWFPGDFEGPGSTGALIHGPGRTPGKTGAMVYLTVPDVESALGIDQREGGKVVMQSTSGEFGTIAHFEDSEGNLVALFAYRQ